MKARYAAACGLAGWVATMGGIAAAGTPTITSTVFPASTARDPGPRGAPAGAGSPLAGLTPAELSVFLAGLDEFNEAEELSEGLGPTLNLDSCAGCHLHPAVGGSSPPVNPQVAFATKDGAKNGLPPFITADGPVREVRFVRNADGSPDGGVHALFTVTGRPGASGCVLKQPDFAAHVAAGNVIFRIPTPVFGAGLIEQISDDAILSNMAGNGAAKSQLGIRGRANFFLPSRTISSQPNRNGNDGTVGRFGWKAQNKSLLVFAGEAYNVEMGVTNELFPTERVEQKNCEYATVPNSVTNLNASTPTEALSAIEKFAFFMRLLAPPQPSLDTPGGKASIDNGRTLFGTVGCHLCHTPAMSTGNAAIAALRYKTANLYSDLLLHDMGAGLADDVRQGQANAREFRTAPLWGLGQRLFFLHDGRTKDVREAVLAHFGDGSEANEVVSRFVKLSDREQQDVLNFLRSL
jgi:CxxC motif-containing protein (DUF1111 family)